MSKNGMRSLSDGGIRDSIKALLQRLTDGSPDTLEEKLEALCDPTPQAVLIQGEEGTGKSRLLSDLEAYARANGLGIIRAGCRKGFNPPFDLAGDLIEQVQGLYPRKAAEIEERYLSVLSEFKHRVYVPDNEDRLTITTTKYISFTRVDEQISGEATIGLIVSLIDYLSEVIRSGNKTTLILLDDIEFTDSWSISFLIHLIRRVKRQPLAVCMTCNPKTKARSGKVRFLLKRGDFFRVALSRSEHPEGAEINNSAAPATEPGSLQGVIKLGLEQLDYAHQLLLCYLSVLSGPTSLKELERIIRQDHPGIRAEHLLNALERSGIVLTQGRGKEAQYLIACPAWKEAVYQSLPLPRRRQYHLNIARVLEKSISGVKQWDWQVGDKINAIYFHLAKGGDWSSLLEYGKAYYSCPVNTYLQHADSNLRELHALISVETGLSEVIKDQVGYQIASDTIRQPRGQTKKKIRQCEKYLTRGIDTYNRANVYANLSVLYSSQRTEAAYRKALECCDSAYREAEAIKDPDLSMHITAIIHSSKALTHFRLKEARAAIELEEAALRLVESARVTPARQVISRLAILSGLAQIYEKMLGDHKSAKAIYLELIKDARERGDAENEAENLISLAKALYNAGRYKEALVYFRECLEVTGGNHRLFTTCMYAHKAAGYCYRSAGDLDRSTTSFQECLRLAVETADLAEIASLAANIGLNYYKQQRFIRASYFYSTALRISKRAKPGKEVPAYLAYLGVICASTNDYKKAAGFFKRAARAYFCSGDFENTMKYYTASMSCYTSNKKPCHRSLLREIKQAAQLGTESINSTVYENFARAYLDQAAILKQSGRIEDAGEILYNFGGSAGRLKIAPVLTRQYGAVTQPGGVSDV